MGFTGGATDQYILAQNWNETVRNPSVKSARRFTQAAVSSEGTSRSGPDPLYSRAATQSDPSHRHACSHRANRIATCSSILRNRSLSIVFVPLDAPKLRGRCMDALSSVSGTASMDINDKESESSTSSAISVAISATSGTHGDACARCFWTWCCDCYPCSPLALPSAHRQMMVKHRKSASRLRNHLSGFPTERKPCLADTADMPLLQIFSDCMQGYARTLMYVLRRSCEVAASGLTKPNLGTSPFPWVNEGRDR